jgi:hypothetical protein
VVNSTFTQWRWTPILGIIMGINAVIILRFNKKKLEDLFGKNINCI